MRKLLHGECRWSRMEPFFIATRDGGDIVRSGHDPSDAIRRAGIKERDVVRVQALSDFRR